MANITRPQLTTEASYKALQSYADKNGSSLNMLQMFKEDPERFKKLR